jgi:hypothetical protein
VRRVPGVVLLDGAVEQVPEGPLVGLGHPQLEGAGVEVGTQAAGVRARGTAADAVGVEGVAVGVEPADSVGLATPPAVEERLHPGHPVALAGLHLRGRPVDGVDLGLGADAAEEVVARPAVVLEEPVALDVVDDLAVPGQRLLAREVAAHDEAAAAVEQRERLVRDGARGDVGVVDDRPHRLATLLLRHDLGHPGRDAPLDDGEDLLDRPPRRGDARPQRGFDLADRGLQVAGDGLPVRQRCGVDRGGHPNSFGEDS